MLVRRSLFVLAFLMLISPVLAFSTSLRSAEREADQATARNFTTYAVGRGRVEAVVSAIGTIEADQVVSLSFLTAGRVGEIYVEQGQFVFAGEPLLKLDDDNQRIVYDQTVLSLERAELELDDLLAPVSEDDIRIAQANVDSAWGAYLSAQGAVTDADIRAAELAYEQALAAQENAGSFPGAFGGNNLENAQAGAASFNAEIARLQLEQMRQGSGPQANAAYARVVQAQRELDRVKAGPPSSQIDSAALSVQQADAALRRAETALNRTTLTAPFDGIISGLSLEVGTLVGPGIMVVELTDVSPLRLTVQVDEIDIRLIQPGMTARVQLDALPDVLIPASVKRLGVLGNNVEGVVSYDVDLALDDAAQAARVGMTAEASIIVEVREDTLFVPNLYIRLDRRTDQAFVQLPALGADEIPMLREIEVTLGLQGQDNSEVVAGLALNDVIAIDETSGLTLLGN